MLWFTAAYLIFSIRLASGCKVRPGYLRRLCGGLFLQGVAKGKVIKPAIRPWTALVRGFLCAATRPATKHWSAVKQEALRGTLTGQFVTWP